MLTSFRHKGSASSPTPPVQGRHHNGAPSQTNNARKISTESGHKQSQFHEKKALGKRTGGKRIRKMQRPRGMSLQTEIEQTNNAEKEDDSSSTSEETTSPSPKRQNQKITPPATATRKSTRTRQATLATAIGNPIPINAVQDTSATGTKQFEIDSPPEKTRQDSPSLKSLIQGMGFSEKTPE